MATIDDIITLIEEVKEYDTLNTGFYAAPEAQNPLIAPIAKSAGKFEYGVGDEGDLYQGAYEFLHSKGHISTSRLRKQTFRTINLHLIDICADLGFDAISDDDKPGWLKDMLSSKDFTSIYNYATVAADNPELKSNPHLKRVIKLAETGSNDFKSYSLRKDVQRRNLLTLIEFWRGFELYYNVGLNQVCIGSERDERYKEGSQLHRKVLNERVDRMVSYVKSL